MAKFMMAINEEDGAIGQMAKTLNIGKSEVVIMALNLLSYTLEQRRSGNHLTLTKAEDKTKDILVEANAGSINFKMND
jgi:hypothetical protein